MLFNSLQFLIFFHIVVTIFFLLPQKRRWILLLIASYYFYMCWKVEYIVLIIISTLIAYYVAKQMDSLKEKAKKKKWLYLSLMSNLGILFGFKYFNFINENIQSFCAPLSISSIKVTASGSWSRIRTPSLHEILVAPEIQIIRKLHSWKQQYRNNVFDMTLNWLENEKKAQFLLLIWA